MSRDELMACFEYRNGNLYRIKAAGGAKAGDIVGWVTYCNGRPYRKMSFKRRTIYVHHAIFLMAHGYLPKCIDHINSDSLDNRIENLRAATQSQNMANSRRSKANSSGRKGVTWRSDSGKWAAQIMVDGKHISLGSYRTLDEAAEAYAKGSMAFFGEFARSQEASNRAQDRTMR